MSKADSSQETNAKLFIQGQKDTSQQFATKYSEPSSKLEILQTEVKTADLQKEANTLRAELKANEKAMTIERAALQFSLATPGAIPLVKESVPLKAGLVHLSFTIVNPGDADALNGDIVLFICQKCEFASTPTGFVKLPGSMEYQRNYSFERILANTRTQTFEMDVRPPKFVTKFEIGMRYVCHTCVAPLRTQLVEPSNSAVITISK